MNMYPTLPFVREIQREWRGWRLFIRINLYIKQQILHIYKIKIKDIKKTAFVFFLNLM